MSPLRKYCPFDRRAAADAAGALDGGGAESPQKRRKGEVCRAEKEKERKGSAEGHPDRGGGIPCACGACGFLFYRRYDRLVAGV